MKDIFLALDFDGVLNSNDWIWTHSSVEHRDDDFAHIDPSRVEIVDTLVSALDCKVVISSAWRILHTVGELKRGLTTKGAMFARRIVGKTDTSGSVRGLQIQRWMDNYSGHKLVILDDSIDMAHLMPYLVRTNPDTGIVDSDIEKAIAIVNNQ